MKVRRIVLICLAVFLLSLGAGFATIEYFLSGDDTGIEETVAGTTYNAQPSEVKKQPKLTKCINILLVGIDSGEFPGGGVRKEIGRTDTIILAQIDPQNKKIHALSIPRDTLVEITGRGLDKVNHAHVFGGMDLTVETVENFTQLTIDKYVKVDYQGFAYLIDAVGGVEMDVEKDIQSGNYLIKKGCQVLDGEHAYALIRHRREPMGDIARVERQQQLAEALFKQIREKQNLLQITIMALKCKEHITTDLTIKDMILMVNALKEFSEQDIELATVPGTFYEWKGISYWKPKEKDTEVLIEALFGSNY